MNEIIDLEAELRAGIDEFDGQTIIINGNGLFLSENSFSVITKLNFHRCIFIGTHLDFEDIDRPDFYLGFFDCSFKISIDIKNCNFKRLGFRDVKSEKSINISGGRFLNFFFRNNDLETKRENILSNNVSICNLKIDGRVELDHINHKSGEFEFSNNILCNSEAESIEKVINFENSTFNNLKLIQNDFFLETSFAEIEIIQSGLLEKCKFKKVNFSNSIFLNTKFEKCDFLSTTWFEYCGNIERANLKFIACEFKGFVLYNHSTLDILDIERCTYDKSVSFTDAVFNSIKLFEVKFGGGAYFDELKINKVMDKSYLKDKTNVLEWKRTLRAIKQELQKTENKIDFNRFRAYELAAHYEELNYKQNFKDNSILWATKISTDFGNSWTKAFKFTVSLGLTIYLFFYLIENYNHQLELSNWDNWTRLISGFFRFFLVTDFYNPLENERVYLSNPLSWIIFIFGKIVIAFGIYEMIQAFRKFKA